MELSPSILEAVERVKLIQEKRAKEAAEKKARWDFYYEQLKKHTPNQGGAHAKTSRAFHIWGAGNEP